MSFTTTSSYATFDAKAFVNSQSTGFEGAIFDGRYVYLVPNTNGQITRYDTTAPFTTSSSYATFDTKAFVSSNSTGFTGGVFDGRYVYYAPNATARSRATTRQARS